MVAVINYYCDITDEPMNTPKATGYLPRAPRSPLRQNLLSLCVLCPRWLDTFGMRLKHYLPIVQVFYLGSLPSRVCRVSELQFVLVVHVCERATDSKASTGKSEVGSQMTDKDMADSVFSCLRQVTRVSSTFSHQSSGQRSG